MLCGNAPTLEAQGIRGRIVCPRSFEVRGPRGGIRSTRLPTMAAHCAQTGTMSVGDAEMGPKSVAGCLACQQVHQCSLPSAIGANNGHSAAHVNANVEVLQAEVITAGVLEICVDELQQ